MIGKLGPGNKEHLSGNIPLWIGSSNSGTNYLQRRWRLSPIGNILLKRGLRK